MALEGSLIDFGLADILQLIYFQRKTGVLMLHGKADRVRLLFLEGNIISAESRRRMEDNRLGKILAKKGFIREEDLKTILEEQKSTGIKLGTALLQKGLVEKDRIQEILQAQIMETVVQLFSWKQGTYEFTSQGVPLDKELPFSLDTQHLLMEGLRIVDELSVIKDKITLNALFRRTGEEVSELTEEERAILEYIDGENDVSTIIDLTGRDSFEVSKALLSLMDQGLIESSEPVPVVAEMIPAEAKKPSVYLKYLPYLAVIASSVLSLIMVFVLRDSLARNFSASRTIENLRLMIEKYNLQNMSYPDSLSAVTDMRDPWGRPYVYRITEKSFSLRSAGADGIEGTSDDIY